ncbi:hypothetical protein [Streptomyces sp. NPDC059874]|uniref:hypothetical protein n=1 Tax=Streptomyces sp. NPDC059874 TaxID=3346983 RepID=UPI003655D3F5
MTEQNTTGPAPEAVEIVEAPAPQDAVPAQQQPQAPAPQDAVPAQPQQQPQAPGTAPQDAVPAEAPPGGDAAEAPPAPAPKDRRKLFAFLRWTAAVVVFGTVGTGVAYGIAQPERTDIPGLSTKDDGRWVYPALVKPTLPPGAALPFAKDNPDGIHYAGLTELLLPAPQGSKPDSTLKLEKDSVVSVDTFLEEYEPSTREKMKQGFTDDGLRQIVARGWTTPDGTRTRIYLLRFHASGFTDAFEGCGGDMNLNGVNRIEADATWTKAKMNQSGPDATGVTVHEESTPFGDEQIKAGCVQSGDVQAVILQTRKGQVATVPLHQTVILQHQLLS